MKRALISVAIGNVLAQKGGTVAAMGGEVVGMARADFKDRIAAMQMRGTIRTCVKNARREFNRTARSNSRAVEEMMADRRPAP
jgi:hypothetical protein